MIVIDPASAVPPYEQIRGQITEARASGELVAGHRLPPVRHLAAELGLAPNTVARAYRELEASGVIETRGRGGSFVTGSTARLAEGERAACDYVAAVRGLGIAPELALSLVRSALSV